jgi:hypothetical protein
MVSSEGLGVRTMVTVFPAALVVAVLTLVGPGSSPAHASTTFTVNDTTNNADLILNDSPNACDANPLSSGNQCTLRAAIQEANNTPGLDTINFNIPGSGTHTIAPSFPLPDITGPVIINGYSQPGAKANTKANGSDAVLQIELDGNNAGAGASGLAIAAPNSVVKGLVINGFSGVAVILGSSATGSKVQGNFISPDTGGTTALEGNGNCGVTVNGNDITIGGRYPSQRNVISGNAEGVCISGVGNTGVGNMVQGDYIGTTKSGTGDLGNTADGVSIVNRSENSVGSARRAGASNKITYNGDDGVSVSGNTSTGNRILRNSMFSNGGLGIDLGDNSVTPNDGPGDADTSPNNLQNFPEVVSKTPSSDNKTSIVQWKLESTPNTTFTIRLFRTIPLSHEGAFYLGKKSVTTDSAGKASFKSTIDSPSSPAGVTATATDPKGNTSEFR